MRTMEVEAVVRRVDGFGKFVVCGRAETWWVVQRLAVLIEFVRQRFCVLVSDQRRFILELGHGVSGVTGMNWDRMWRPVDEQCR